MKPLSIDEPDRLHRFVDSFSSYSQDFRGLVLKMLESGQSIEQVSSFTGVSVSTLYDWIKDWNEKKKLA